MSRYKHSKMAGLWAAPAKNQWADVVIDVKRPDLSGYSFGEGKHFIREGEKRADRMMRSLGKFINIA